jgi:hypothetical protein
MSEYEVDTWEVNAVDGDDQIELVITSTDGNRWEYGIPFSKSSGRYTFEEIDVIATDFGEELAEEVTEKIDALVEKLCD